MKKLFIVSTIAAAIAFNSAYAADSVTTTTQTQIPVVQVPAGTSATPAAPQISTIITKLQSKGYNIIRKIKFEDGAYEADVINAQGNEVTVKINPLTGDFFGSTENLARLSMLAAVKVVEAAGYKNIYKVKSDDDKYEVKALDKNGKEVGLEVNAISGEISKNWF
jgi:hypothetical protein